MSDAQPPSDEDPDSNRTAKKPERNDRRWVKVGFGAAIGSAAIAAALLYANRSGRNDRS